jgi:hypothetical protein
MSSPSSNVSNASPKEHVPLDKATALRIQTEFAQYTRDMANANGFTGDAANVWCTHFATTLGASDLFTEGMDSLQTEIDTVRARKTDECVLDADETQEAQARMMLAVRKATESANKVASLGASATPEPDVPDAEELVQAQAGVAEGNAAIDAEPDVPDAERVPSETPNTRVPLSEAIVLTIKNMTMIDLTTEANNIGLTGDKAWDYVANFLCSPAAPFFPTFEDELGDFLTTLTTTTPPKARVPLSEAVIQTLKDRMTTDLTKQANDGGFTGIYAKAWVAGFLSTPAAPFFPTFEDELGGFLTTLTTTTPPKARVPLSEAILQTIKDKIMSDLTKDANNIGLTGDEAEEYVGDFLCSPAAPFLPTFEDELGGFLTTLIMS